MKTTNPNELKKKLIKKLHPFYILLGEDFCLLERNQNLILNFSYKKGFLEKVIIDIEKDKDWNKIVLLYKTKNLFFKKTTLIINFLIKKLNNFLIEKVYKIFFLFDSDILIILKFNHLSYFVQRNKLLNKFLNCHYNSIVSCFTPYNLSFINWIQYEIKEKNINMEEKALSLLCKHYKGNTLFIYNVLNIISITWPDTPITRTKLKKIIIDFFEFSELSWINSIFENQREKSIYILNIFLKRKYNPLVLVRSLQKDLYKLIHMKRETKINMNTFSEDYNISSLRDKHFMNALKKINCINLLKAIQILVKIEINIKKKYNNDVWNQLQELTLILCN